MNSLQVGLLKRGVLLLQFWWFMKKISDAKAKKYHVELLSEKASSDSSAHKIRAYLASAAATV